MIKEPQTVDEFVPLFDHVSIDSHLANDVVEQSQTVGESFPSASRLANFSELLFSELLLSFLMTRLNGVSPFLHSLRGCVLIPLYFRRRSWMVRHTSALGVIWCLLWSDLLVLPLTWAASGEFWRRRAGRDFFVAIRHFATLLIFTWFSIGPKRIICHHHWLVDILICLGLWLMNTWFVLVSVSTSVKLTLSHELFLLFHILIGRMHTRWFLKNEESHFRFSHLYIVDGFGASLRLPGEYSWFRAWTVSPWFIQAWGAEHIFQVRVNDLVNMLCAEELFG